MVAGGWAVVARGWISLSHQATVDCPSIVRFLSVSLSLSPSCRLLEGSTVESFGSFYTYAVSRSPPAIRSLSLTMLQRSKTERVL